MWCWEGWEGAFGHIILPVLGEGSGSCLPLGSVMWDPWGKWRKLPLRAGMSELPKAPGRQRLLRGNLAPWDQSEVFREQIPGA